MRVRLQLFSILVFTLVISFAKAQNKIGYVNLQHIIALMPEAITADSILKAYQAELGNEGAELWKRTDSIVQHFGCHNCGPVPDSVKGRWERQIKELYQVAANWQQTAQDLYNKRAEKLIIPIRKKVLYTIETIAKENNYDYVLDASGNELIIISNADNLLLFTEKRLGITDTTVASEKIFILAFFVKNENELLAKVAYIDTDSLAEVIQLNSDIVKQLAIYKDSLTDYGQAMYNKMYKLDSSLIAGNFIEDGKMVSLSNAIQLHRQADDWQQKAEGLYNNRKKELLAAVSERALTAVKSAAKEKGFTYVIDTANNNLLLVKPAGSNLLKRVDELLALTSNCKE